MTTKAKKRNLYQRFACWIGWHSHSFFRRDGGFESVSFDGASVHARCRWCGYEGMIDSQGNLF